MSYSLDTTYTKDELNKMTVADIKKYAATKGYSITTTKKADIVNEIVEQQKAVIT